MVALREAALINERDARLWTQYADQCLRARKPHDAREALRHALWLRERDHEHGKARTTRDMLSRIDPGHV